MTRPATRERKERFISSFDAYSFSMKTALTAISNRIEREGLSWLTDDQLSDITEDVLEAVVSSQRRMIRNRNIRRVA